MRILVAGDDPSVAQALAEVLRVEGHDVLVALGGVEALNVVETTTVDGVFLDLVMPGLDGFSVSPAFGVGFRICPWSFSHHMQDRRPAGGW
jgi:CheY-like chemotaxis protein